MTVLFKILIAVNIKDVGGLTRTNETVSNFCSQMELNGLAGFGSFDRELLLYLSPRAKNAPAEDE